LTFAPEAQAATVRVRYIVTAAAEAALKARGTTADAYTTLITSRTNTVLANTPVSHRIAKNGFTRTSYVESGSTGTDLLRLRNPTDGHMDGVWGQRGTADYLVLVSFSRALTSAGASYGCSSDPVINGNIFWAEFEVPGDHQRYWLAHEFGHAACLNHADQYPRFGGTAYGMCYLDGTASVEAGILCSSLDSRRIVRPWFTNPARTFTTLDGVPSKRGVETRRDARAELNRRWPIMSCFVGC
jgi:hypothetical protein